jgi:uncharacterized damage-inducible protein DinB
MDGEREVSEEGGSLPERVFGWQDMFVAPEDDPRSQEPAVGERATLLSYLDAYRRTLELKCAGLDAAAMAARSVPPSDLSLLGLVRHLAEAERHWFRRVLGGEDVDSLWRTEADREAPFTGAVADEAVVAEAWARWREEVDYAERLVDLAPDLGVNVAFGDNGERLALREVLVHMIEEYARHCGHADLLRERIDGRVGQ